MKKLPLLLLVLFCSLQTYAHHGKGGSITYQYLGSGSAANTSKYQITVTHYVACDRIGDEPSKVYLGIFDAATNTLKSTVTIAQSSKKEIQKLYFNPCINPAPSVCYYLVIYVTTVELSDNSGGYILAEQDCCRADEIVNISNPSGTGFTNINTIPGVINGVVYRNNNSPELSMKDTAVICHNSYFTIDFGATDPDGDQLTYEFCSAKNSGSTTRQPDPPSNPPYSDVSYTNGYTGSAPMGSNVTINAQTGIISGIAPATEGAYVISVCITEWRNGVAIGVTKKEVLVTVADCSLTAASLETSYINCDDYTFHFSNQSSSSNINSYHWDFGVPGTTSDVSTEASPAFNYPDTGTYTLKLRVTSIAGCEDSTSAPVRVYPGFKPGFTVTGSCYQTPFQFTDTTKTKYGTVNSWLWNFGDGSGTGATTSSTSHTYQIGSYNASLIVGNSKGCIDTVTKAVSVSDKPALNLPFRDTLICSIDTLPLKANGSGIFSWTPASNMIGANTANPIVFPKDTTTYTVTLTEAGCVASDSVKVNVLDFVSVSLPADTTICKTDSIRINTISDALHYVWSPVNSLNDATAKYPYARPQESTTYQVIVNVGKCQASASTTVKVVAYPNALAWGDTTICYGGTAQLYGSTTGATFSWLPTTTGSGSLSPLVSPLQTTQYIFTAYDTLGCPKPSHDTVNINVMPRINAFAGNDTTVVLGQPLQLHASGGTVYSWSPSSGLSNTNIASPMALFDSAPFDSLLYSVKVSNDYGCYAFDTIKVTIFKTGANIFVPSGFTPNGDGKNDVLRPIMVGMKSLTYFKVFNRWGQMVYSTSTEGEGWNGKVGGMDQSTGVFVYITEGVTYDNIKIMRKGTVVLVR